MVRCSASYIPAAPGQRPDGPASEPWSLCFGGPPVGSSDSDYLDSALACLPPAEHGRPRGARKIQQNPPTAALMSGPVVRRESRDAEGIPSSVDVEVAESVPLLGCPPTAYPPSLAVVAVLASRGCVDGASGCMIIADQVRALRTLPLTNLDAEPEWSKCPGVIVGTPLWSATLLSESVAPWLTSWAVHGRPLQPPCIIMARAVLLAAARTKPKRHSTNGTWTPYLAGQRTLSTCEPSSLSGIAAMARESPGPHASERFTQPACSLSVSRTVRRGGT